MLLTIATTHQPATDLGYLLHKNPASVNVFDLSFGKAYVFYPEATAERCSASLLLDIDPVGMVRGRQGQGPASLALEQYVNDRPYVASSFLSVAIAQVYGNALAGKSRERPELAQAPLPLQARLAVVPCQGGEGLLQRLFEPLGYMVDAQRHVLDTAFAEWGDSRYFTVTLTATCILRDLLAHLYVLIPVLDNEKHYWVGDDEVEKLLRHGAGWLAAHPERALIAQRYLRRQHNLIEDALARLIAEDSSKVDTANEAPLTEETNTEERVSLHTMRLLAVHAALRESGAKSVLDLGCGAGKLLKLLLADPTIERILGLDVAYHALTIAQQKLHLERLPERQRQRITLIHGALTYRDRRLEGYDAAAVVEVIEHLDPPRLAAFERVLFEGAHPGTVIITTPNSEFNVRFPTLPAGAFRHRDHRFEWTRAQFQAWANGVADRFGYTTRFQAVGGEDPEVGPPSQMALFNRKASPSDRNYG
jgi:3' terminal RNA ribose 2'-O-methyltransferase Hen1